MEAKRLCGVVQEWGERLEGWVESEVRSQGTEERAVDGATEGKTGDPEWVWGRKGGNWEMKPGGGEDRAKNGKTVWEGRWMGMSISC